jgi:hypothetical protein
MLPMAIAARWDDYFKKEIVDQHFHKKMFLQPFWKNVRSNFVCKEMLIQLFLKNGFFNFLRNAGSIFFNVVTFLSLTS